MMEWSLLMVASLATQLPEINHLFTVGSEEGGDTVAFGRIIDLAIDDDARLFVLDGSDARVRVFDSKGDPAGVFGGIGDGPTELRRPTALDWIDTTLAVTHSGRVSEFDADGGLAGGRRLPGLAFVRAFPLDAERALLLREGVARARAVDPGQVISVLDGDETRTLATGASGAVFVRHASGSLALEAGLCGTLAAAYVSADAYVIANGRDGTLALYEADELARTFQVTRAASPLSRDRQQEIETMVRRSSAGRAASVEVITPPHESTICGIEVESRTIVWFKEPQTPDDSEAWRSVNLSTGEVSSPLRLESGWHMMAVRAGRGAAAWADELGRPLVTVFEVRR